MNDGDKKIEKNQQKNMQNENIPNYPKKKKSINPVGNPIKHKYVHIKR